MRGRMQPPGPQMFRRLQQAAYWLPPPHFASSSAAGVHAESRRGCRADLQGQGREVFQTRELVMSARPYQLWTNQRGFSCQLCGVGRRPNCWIDNELAAMANTGWPCHGCRLETARHVSAPVPVPVIWDLVVVVVVCEEGKSTAVASVTVTWR